MAGMSGDEPTTKAEVDRRRELARFDILDTPSEPEYDHIAELAAQFFVAPIAAISLIDGNRVWFKAKVGLDLSEAPRPDTFCNHTVDRAEPFVVCDATADPRFAENPFVVPIDGLRFYAGVPLATTSGTVVGTVCVFDVVARPMPSEREMRMLEGLARIVVDRLETRPVDNMRRMAQAIAEKTPDAILCVDAAGTITSWNEGASKIFGWSREEALGQRLDLIVPDRFARHHLRGFPGVLVEGRAPRMGSVADLKGRHRFGHEVPIELSLSMWRDERGDAIFGAIIRDVSERRRQEDRLRWLAHFDALTGTPNRATLAQDLGALIADRFTGDDGVFTLALLDLDGFKDVNDTLGHSTGDLLLRHVADRLVAAIGREGTVYRLGGDEFALLLPHVGEVSVAMATFSGALAAVARPYEFDGVAIDVEASVGFAMCPHDGATVEDLMGNADLALYRAKRSRSGVPCRFTQDLRADVTMRRTLDVELRSALINGEFELHYQPQLDYSRDHWSGAEALLRWRHPSRGLIGPSDFMSVLEASTLSVQVGNWVLHTACRQAAIWRRQALGFETVAINLFPTQLRHPDFLEEVKRALASSGLPPRALELEVTEKIALSLDETPLLTLQSLRELGVKLAFDDFGTGYASLSALKRYPVDRLKIDRSFVRDLPDDESDSAIVSSIIAITSALGLDVVAEGVETVAQRDHLIRRGCLVGQGFLHAPPLPAEDLENLVRRRPAAE